MKKILTALIIITTLCSATVFAINPDVHVNGKAIVSDQPAVIENGRTLVPMRGVLEAMGAKVDWDTATETVTATRGNTTVSVLVGGNSITVNGKAYALDVPAKTINGRTMIPVRAVSEALGCKVDWDDGSKTVMINEILGATRTDMERLSEILEGLFLDMGDNGYYRYYAFSPDSARKATNMAIGKLVPFTYSFVFSDYTWSDNYSDPKGLFGGNAICLPAEKVDWIKENVFNVVAEKTTFRKMHYYYNDYYYKKHFGIGPPSLKVDIVSAKKQPDNTYELVCKAYQEIGGWEGEEPDLIYYGTYSVVTGLKVIDNIRVWSFYSVEDEDDKYKTESETSDI